MIEQLEKLEKSQQVFNVQLDHFGEVRAPVEEPVKDEKINEFRYVCILIKKKNNAYHSYNCCVLNFGHFEILSLVAKFAHNK